MEIQVGRRIRELRKARGMTQQQLAERSGLNEKYLGVVERTGENLTLRSIQRIAKALSVPIANLFTGEPERNDKEVVPEFVRVLLEEGNLGKLRKLRVFLEQILQ